VAVWTDFTKGFDGNSVHDQLQSMPDVLVSSMLCGMNPQRPGINADEDDPIAAKIADAIRAHWVSRRW
jgi:hypothetical protein